MNESESRPTFKSSFAEDALAAMIRAQKVAACENARYGMSLIVEKSQRPAKRKVKSKAANRRPTTPR